MRIDIVTVFPEMIAAALDHSIVKRARERGLVTIQVINLRDFTTDRHKTTDDTPYGGGGGMVMKIEPIARALVALRPASAQTRETETDLRTSTPAETVEVGENAGETEKDSAPPPRVILTDPRGPRFTQETARRWAQEPHIILLCGHYEGVDERVRRHLITDEVSIGDYILTGGELPALVIVDALTRLQPGALGDAMAPEKDTFAENLLEYPHYTRPRVFGGWEAPDILLSGHHAQIERWRRWHQLRATRERRPDLFELLQLSPQDRRLLASEEPRAPEEALKHPKTKVNAVPSARDGQETETADIFAESEDDDGAGTGNDT